MDWDTLDWALALAEASRFLRVLYAVLVGSALVEGLIFFSDLVVS